MAVIIPISDFNARELDIFARTSEGQLLNRAEPEKGLFIAESLRVIKTAIESGYEPVSMLIEDRHVDTQAEGLIPLLGDIPVYTAPFDMLTQITGFQLTRGALCAMKRPPLPDLSQVLDGASRIVILEEVMNPTNVGAVFRSAAALGLDAVLLTHGCSNPYYRRSIRVSMGTVFQIPWTFISENNWPSFLGQLKNMGYMTAAMALSDQSVSIDDPLLNSSEKLALVMGTEGDGLKAETISACDMTVRIPMMHGVDSLNVAAASAVAFWQLRKRL